MRSWRRRDGPFHERVLASRSRGRGNRAARWYAARVPGLDGSFLDAVDAAVGDILSDPARFAILSDEIRLYLVRRFPYGIYFRIVDDTVRILAVRHHRQRPGVWRGRR